MCSSRWFHQNYHRAEDDSVILLDDAKNPTFYQSRRECRVRGPRNKWNISSCRSQIADDYPIDDGFAIHRRHNILFLQCYRDVEGTHFPPGWTFLINGFSAGATSDRMRIILAHGYLLLEENFVLEQVCSFTDEVNVLEYVVSGVLARSGAVTRSLFALVRVPLVASSTGSDFLYSTSGCGVSRPHPRARMDVVSFHLVVTNPRTGSSSEQGSDGKSDVAGHDVDLPLCFGLETTCLRYHEEASVCGVEQWVVLRSSSGYFARHCFPILWGDWDIDT